MGKPLEQKIEINYIMLVYGKVLVRMNTKTGVSWYYENNYWLPVKEGK